MRCAVQAESAQGAIRLTFDRSVNPASLTAASITHLLSAKGTALTVQSITAVPGSNDTEFDISYNAAALGSGSIYGSTFTLTSSIADAYGTHWEPVVSAFFGGHPPNGFHFASQLSDGHIVVEEYYNANQKGFGTFFKIPETVKDGYSAFGPGDLNDPRNRRANEGYRSYEKFRFTPFGMHLLTPFASGNDLSASMVAKDQHLVGKVTHPSGAPDNHLWTVWSTPVPVANGSGKGAQARPIDGGIYLIKSGKPIGEPGQMLLIKNDPRYDEQWPRALVPYQRTYGVAEPRRLRHANDGTLSPHLPAGTSFGLVGTSSQYKRESYPGGAVPPGGVTAGRPGKVAPNDFPSWMKSIQDVLSGGVNWRTQGSDAGVYQNRDIHGIRILAMESSTHVNREARFLNHAMERLRIVAEIPVRKFEGRQAAARPGRQPRHQLLGKVARRHGLHLPADRQERHDVDDGAELAPGEAGGNPQRLRRLSRAQPETNLIPGHGRGETRVPDLGRNRGSTAADHQEKRSIQQALGGAHAIRRREPGRCALCQRRAQCRILPGRAPPPRSQLRSLSYVERGPSTCGNEGVVTCKVPGDFTTMQWRGKPVPAGWAAQEDNRRNVEPAYTGSVMPPPAAVAGTYRGTDGRNMRVAPVTDEDRLTLVRWIDLGCPIDLDYEPGHPEKRGYGWMFQESRPTLTLAYPQAGANSSLTRILLGTNDYYTGLDLKSFAGQVLAGGDALYGEIGYHYLVVLAGRSGILSDGRPALSFFRREAEQLVALAGGQLSARTARAGGRLAGGIQAEKVTDFRLASFGFRRGSFPAWRSCSRAFRCSEGPCRARRITWLRRNPESRPGSSCRAESPQCWATSSKASQ